MSDVVQTPAMWGFQEMGVRGVSTFDTAADAAEAWREHPRPELLSLRVTRGNRVQMPTVEEEQAFLLLISAVEDTP